MDITGITGITDITDIMAVIVVVMIIAGNACKSPTLNRYAIRKPSG
jgi:hypothetical protein